MSQARDIHIDTDPGLDDLLALAVALGSPEIRLAGISTVAGNAALDAVTDNAIRFLALCGANVPVGRGAAGPLSLQTVNAESVHGADGRRGIHMPEVPLDALPSARDVLGRSLESGVDCVIALGPLTNLAELVLEEPDLFRETEVVWMGGSLGPGNATPVAEFNAFADPEALGVLLASDVRLRVIGLDVTRNVVVRPEHLQASLFGSDAVGHFLDRVLRELMDAERPLVGEPVATLHDPCAVFAAIFPDLFRYEDLSLEVRVEAGRERGRLVGRPPRASDRGRRAVRYATEVQGEEIRLRFLERLASLEAFA